MARRRTRTEKMREMASRPRTDPYEVLGVSRGADASEVKAAYRRMAVLHHPDKNRGSAEAEARFKEVSEAYDVLSDEDKRAIFDEFGVDGLQKKREERRASARRERAPAPVVAHEARRRRDEDENVYVGVVGGLPHWHRGRVVTCVACGIWPRQQVATSSSGADDRPMLAAFSEGVA